MTIFDSSGQNVPQEMKQFLPDGSDSVVKYEITTRKDAKNRLTTPESDLSWSDIVHMPQHKMKLLLTHYR